MKTLLLSWMIATISVLASDNIDLTELAKDKSQWPAEVTLTDKITMPVMAGGKQRGTTELPAGTKLKLVQVLGEQLRVSYGESVKTIEARATDICERVAEARTRSRLKLNTQVAPRASEPALSAVASGNPFLRITVERKSKTNRQITQQANVRYYPSARLQVHSPEVLDTEQNNTVFIKIENISSQSAKGLIVKYAAFAERLSNDSPAAGIMMRGAITVDIEGQQTVVVETEPFQIETRSVTYKGGAFEEDNTRIGSKYSRTGVKIYREQTLIAKYGPDWEE